MRNKDVDSCGMSSYSVMRRCSVAMTMEKVEDA